MTGDELLADDSSDSINSPLLSLCICGFSTSGERKKKKKKKVLLTQFLSISFFSTQKLSGSGPFLEVAKSCVVEQIRFQQTSVNY